MPKDAEERISKGVLRIATAQANGIATFSRCRADIPNVVKLTAADLSPSVTRPGEPMWHQIVRNIKCHEKEDNNYIATGYLVHLPRWGYQITNAGRVHLNKH